MRSSTQLYKTHKIPYNTTTMQFAVIKTGGKQYKVQEGDILSVEKFDHEGDNVVFDQVLLWVKAKDIKVGKPLIPGAKVEAKVLEDGTGDDKTNIQET